MSKPISLSWRLEVGVARLMALEMAEYGSQLPVITVIEEVETPEEYV